MSRNNNVLPYPFGSTMTSQVCESLYVLPSVQELQSCDSSSSEYNTHLPGSGFSLIKQVLQHPVAGSPTFTARV